MSVRDLEIELARSRGETKTERSNATPLSIVDALAFRNAGNVPDELGRSLRLVLLLGEGGAAELNDKRLRWEPDFHEAPDWRGPGSVPVNVVPLQQGPDALPRDRRDDRGGVGGSSSDAWWADPALARLEEEWTRTGTVAGLRVPGEYRGFVYKTILSLQSSGRPITVASVVDSISRWLDVREVTELREALEAAND